MVVIPNKRYVRVRVRVNVRVRVRLVAQIRMHVRA